MAKRIKVGITLTEETLKRLNELCEVTGLMKSQAISLALNTYVVENLEKLKGEKRDKK